MDGALEPDRAQPAQRAASRASTRPTRPPPYPPDGVWGPLRPRGPDRRRSSTSACCSRSAPRGRPGRTRGGAAGRGIRRPDARAFGDFVAGGRASRYSGPSSPTPQGHPRRRPPGSPLPTLPGQTPAPGPAPAEQTARLPRVDHWSLYNEPELPRLADAAVRTAAQAGDAPPITRPRGTAASGRLGEVGPRRRHDPPGRDGAVRRSRGRGAASSLGLGGADAALRARDVLPVGPLPPVARARRPGARLPRHRGGPAPVQSRAPRAVRGARMGPPPLHAPRSEPSWKGHGAHRHRDRVDQPPWRAPRSLAPGLAQLQAARPCGSPSSATRRDPTRTGRCHTPARRDG